MARTVTRTLKAGRNLLVAPPARKRDQRRKVQHFKRDLRPGVWLLSASNVARHWKSRQPPTLARSAHGSKKATSSSRWVRGARRVLYLWGMVLPPWTTRVPKIDEPHAEQHREQGAHPQRHTLLATKAHRTDVILLEPPRKVLRTHHAAPITSEQMEVREALARHFDVPHFEVDGDGVRVVEEFVDGTPISTLSGAERDEAVAEVLRRYACVARDEARSDARELLASHLERARSASRAPHRFTHALTEREPRILARSESWPLTPAHVSSQANNYLLSGDQLIPLDFQNPVYAPFFFDALKLCTTELIQEASRQNRPLVPMIADRYGAGLLPLYQEVEVELTPEVLEDSWLAFAATAMGRGSSRWRRWVGAWDP